MVATLVRLKWQLLRNQLKRSTWQMVGLVVGVLYAGFFVVLACAGLVSLRAVGDVQAIGVGLTLAGALLLLGWILLPLLLFGTDPTMDPARFATFPIPPRQLVRGLTLSGLVGMPSVATGLLLLSSVITWSRGLLAFAVALVSAVVALLTMIVASRLVTTVMAKVLSSRRGRDISTIVLLLCMVILGPTISLIGNAKSIEAMAAQVASVAQVVGWTPLGWPFSAPADVAAGAVGTGLLKMLLSLGLLVLLMEIWARSMRAALESPGVQAGESVSLGDNLGWFARLPGTATGAIAARLLTYWRRDPRFQMSLLMTPLVPLFLLVPYFTSSNRNPVILIAMAPLGALMIGWSEHNNLAYDSTAYWMDLSAPAPGSADRLGRLAPSLAMCVVVIVVYSLVGCLVTGRADLLPGVLGVSIGLAAAGYGMSMVAAVLKPYPVPGPGESPFATPSGAAGITMLVQTVGFLSVAILSIPFLVLAGLTWSGATWAGWALLVTGIVLGAVYFVAGWRVGARRYDTHGAELMRTLSDVK